MADKIILAKDQLHHMYDQVTSQPGSAAGKGEGSTASKPTASQDSVTHPSIGSPNEATTASDRAQHEADTRSGLDSRNEPAGVVASPDFGARHDARQDLDVGPRNEAIPEHHHNQHHQGQSEHGPHRHSQDKSDHLISNNTNAPKGIDYGNVSHLETTDNTNTGPSAPRRQSLADSAYRGNIHETVSPPSPEKKWSFSMGDFGLKLPKQHSNAVSQELNKDGSVSMQGGQVGRAAARGIGSISSTVKRGSVDSTASKKDPTKRWSFNHGDFGLKLPSQQSNALAQELNRDGSVSSQGNGGGQGLGAAASAATTAVPLGRQGARGIGSISSSVRKGSVDMSASHHDKHRKWSLKDADFGLKFPKQASNLQN
jgi:hypothetical protein